MSRIARAGIGRKALCVGLFLVGAVASGVVSAQELPQRLRIDEVQRNWGAIGSGFELSVARSVLESGESFRFQTRPKIGPIVATSGDWAPKRAADGDVIVSVSRVGGNGGEVFEQDAGSEWRLRQPGISSGGWAQWLLLLPVAGGFAGAGYALKRRREEGDSLEIADIEAYLPRVTHRVLPSRPAVSVTLGSAPRLVLRVTKASSPPCVQYRRS